MKFSQIVIIDDCGLTPAETEKIAALSEKPLIIFRDNPLHQDEILARIGKADAVLVSWHTQLSAEIIQAMENVRYIGMCCSLYNENAANVNIAAAREKGMVVKGVRDYGDEGTVEFIFAQLIALFKGFGSYQWRSTLQELKGKSIGIIGMGTLGKMVADTALHFGMEVFYYNRSPRPGLPTDLYHPLGIEELLATCDIITTHVPKHNMVITDELFSVKKKNSVFINTSLGPTYGKKGLLQWLQNDPSSFAIFDQEGCGPYLQEFTSTPNIIVYSKSSGSTIEAKKRLSEKVYQNLVDFLREH